MTSSKRKSSTKSILAPSAPYLELLEHQYGSEAGCDVVFLVGPSEDNCLRIPAHTHILRRACPVFDAMFSPNFSTPRERQSLLIEGEGEEAEERIPIPQQVHVPDLDGKAFDNLMKYLYEIPVGFQTVETTIETLKAANKYQCTSLIRDCVIYLSSEISVENVLFITANMALLCGDYQNLENLCRECTDVAKANNGCFTLPEALEKRLTETNPMLNIELDCAWLVYNCLDFIDKNAKDVVDSEEMEDLDFSTIHHILSRDTLNVDELYIFNAIIRWADKKCKERHLPLTSQSKREVLQDLLYVPRYLLMSYSIFICGPVRSGVLSEEEIETITRVIQLGPDPFKTGTASERPSSSTATPSPDCSPFKRIQNLGIPASQSLRIHLGYMLRPRRKPEDRDANNGKVSSAQNQDGNWKWVARLKKMRCCLLCCEGGNNGPSRCTSPDAISSPMSPTVRSSSGFSDDHRGSVSSVEVDGSARREPYKAGFVERAVVIFACLFD